MKIKIDNKYLNISDVNGPITYFENFESKGKKRNVIAISSEDRKGDTFVKKHHGTMHEVEISWFGGRFLKRQVMFIKEKEGNAFNYLIILN